MTYDLFSLVFCCFNFRKEEANDLSDEPINENTRLIPDDIEPMYSDPALMNNFRIQQKFDEIVRAKERKMVDLGSQIPFNLHNIQILPQTFDHYLSRNSSQCSDYFDSTDDSYHKPVYHQQQAYPSGPHPRFTTSASPSPYSGRSRSRSPSIEREQSTPILNVRLVGVEGQRGRTTRRYHPEASSSKASDTTPTSSNFQNVSDNPTSSNASTLNFKLDDVGAISVSWGD